MTWTPTAPTVVYSGTPGVQPAETTIDLSAHVGAQKCFVYLKVWNNAAAYPSGLCHYSFSTDIGLAIDSYRYNANWGLNSHSYYGQLASSFIVLTDSLGKVKLTTSVATVTTVTLLGWLEPTFDPLTVSHSLLATTWQEYDFSSKITGLSLAFFRVREVTATGGVGVTVVARRKGDTWDPAYDLANCRYGCQVARAYKNAPGTVDCHAILCIPVGADGLIEVQAHKIADIELVLLGHVSVSTVTPVTIYDGNGNAAYTDVDTFKASSLVYINYNRKTGGAGADHCMIRPNGDLDAWNDSTVAGYGTVIRPWGTNNDGTQVSGALIPSDASGLVEWKRPSAPAIHDVRLMVFASYGGPPPTFSNKLPSGAGQQYDVEISFSCADDTQVDSATIDVDLTGPGPTVYNAIVNGVFQTGFAGTIVANGSNGYDVAITTHPALVPGAWTVDVEADDDGGGTGTDSWGFTVDVPSDPPQLTYEFPDGFTPDIPENITFSLIYPFPFDLSTLSIQVLETTGGEVTSRDAMLLGVAQPGWTIALLYDAAYASRVDVVISEWPFSIDSTYHRVQLIVDCDTDIGVPL